MDHDDLIKNLIANSEPDDPLSVALIENIRERKRIFREMIGNSRFIKEHCRAFSNEHSSEALH